MPTQPLSAPLVVPDSRRLIHVGPCKLRRAAPLLLLLVTSIPLPGLAFDAPTALPDGWDAKVQFGAVASSGKSTSSSLSLETGATYRGGRFENALQLKLLRSAATLEIERENDAGEPVLEADGSPSMQRVRDTTADRRFVHVEPRWYLPNERNYVFGFLDYDTNRPGGLESSTRQIGGVGYRLWNDRANYLAMGVGIGHKRLESTDGEVSDGGIGYFGVKVVLALTERAKLDAGLDTDFGGDSNFTEFGLGLAFKLNDPVALKFRYEARVNSGLEAENSELDNQVEGRVSVNLEIDVL